MDRPTPESMTICLCNACDEWTEFDIAADGSGEVRNLDGRTKAIDRLQKVHSELTELHLELKDADLEPKALGIFRDTLDQMRATARTLQQGMEGAHPANRQGLLGLLIDDQMRRASQLNIEIGKDIEKGKIRTDQDGLSAYLLVLNQVMEQVDLAFGSRKAER
jgi:hypothetical protein